MTEFNYLVHGSLLFAAGLTVGLLGALLVTRRGRAAQKDEQREQTAERELPNDADAASDGRIPVLDTPRPTAMPIPSLRPAHAEPLATGLETSASMAPEPLSGLVAERPAAYDSSSMNSSAERDALNESMQESMPNKTVREEPVLTNPRTGASRVEVAQTDRALNITGDDIGGKTGGDTASASVADAVADVKAKPSASATSSVPSKEDPDYADPEHVARTLRQALISGGKSKTNGAT